MKKAFATLLCLCLLATALCACGTKPQDPAASADGSAETPLGMPNPMTEYSSLGEINELTHGRLCHPPVMGVTDESFWVIEGESFDIAQYCFSVAGVNYTFRFSPEAVEDISGIYVEDGTLFGNELTDCRTAKAFDGGLATRFHTIDGQYVLIGTSEEAMDEETFNSVSDELFSLVVPEESDGDAAGSAFLGSWHDKIAGRASMEVTAGDEGYLCFEVEWPDSASARYVFAFTGALSEQGVVEYDGGFKGLAEYDNSGSEKKTILSEEEAGTVEITADGTMLWTDTSGVHEFVKD